MDLDQRILEQIRQEDIRMRSRWFFRFKDMVKCALVFSAVGVSSVCVGISMAIILHWMREISAADFPYVLVVVALIMVFLASVVLIRLFSLYKIRLSLWMASLGAVACFFGYILFSSGLVERLERSLQEFPLYQAVTPKMVWDYEASEGDRD